MKIENFSAQDKAIIRTILKDYKNVFVFGSRVKGSFKQYSDLDLCFKDHLSDYESSLLEEKFEESDLPVRVDLVDYNSVDKAFREKLDSEMIPLEDFLAR